MSKLKQYSKKVKYNFRFSPKNNRKKHVETMFITNKHKNYPFYFKPKNVSSLVEGTRKRLASRHYFHVRCLRSGYVDLAPLKAIIRLYKYYFKTMDLEENDLKYRLHIFPDFVLTSKPREVRMGKGKGANLSKAAIVKKGQIVFSLSCRRYLFRVARILIRKLAFKLPLSARVVQNI